ncbi:MAG: UDP-N-acetylmuramoyl-tripeptide--D-alanyl-D-alanine ligase, partial [Cyanobacteriota bacterium]
MKLAAAWRATVSCPIVGITGSIGKTTTKELLGAMVRGCGKKCVVSEGNFNTLLGAAMTLLQLRADHDCAVVEMGVSRRGEMAQLADLIRPTIGVITTVAHQHMDGLGGLSDIAVEKRDIFKFFKTDSIGIINGDQPLLSAVSYSHPVARFGYKTTNQVQARRVIVNGSRITGLVRLYDEQFPVTLLTPHKGRLSSFLASATAAYFLKIPTKAIVKALDEFEAVPGRFQPLPLVGGKGVIINDSYNANPESMKEALWAFDRLDVQGRKVAVIGDMLGLGAASSFWHRQLGRSLRKMQTIDRVILVGSRVRDAEKTIPRGFSYAVVADWQGARKEVESLMVSGE